MSDRSGTLLSFPLHTSTSKNFEANHPTTRPGDCLGPFGILRTSTSLCPDDHLVTHLHAWPTEGKVCPCCHDLMTVALSIQCERSADTFCRHTLQTREEGNTLFLINLHVVSLSNIEVQFSLNRVGMGDFPSCWWTPHLPR